MAKVHLSSQYRGEEVDQDLLVRAARTVLEGELSPGIAPADSDLPDGGKGCPAVSSEGVVEIVLVGDEEIRELNRRHLNRDAPTDVLSFSYLGEEFARGILGEIYISLDRAQAALEEYGAPFREELVRLVVHGILHLLGEDHEGGQAEAFLDKQERYIRELLSAESP